MELQEYLSTSHLDLKLPKKARPVLSILRIPMPKPALQPMEISTSSLMSCSDDLLDLIGNGDDAGGTVAEDKDVARPQQATD